MLTRLPTLQRLWELEAELKQRPGGSRWPFSGIGLGLTPLCRRYYFCTPLNAETFATTQGDGVHFSLLLSDGEVSEDSPVVMTLPANSGDHNRIVGENLREFLALGIDCSYSMLEQIVYQGFERFDIRDRDGQSAENRTVLDEIARMFDLSPWPSPAERFAELNANYLPLLRHPVDWLDD